MNEQTVTKVIQLYETKTSRHAVMIVGSTLSGKSVAWKILQATMTRLSKGGDPNYQIVKVRIPLYLIFVTASARVVIQTIRL